MLTLLLPALLLTLVSPAVDCTYSGSAELDKSDEVKVLCLCRSVTECSVPDLYANSTGTKFNRTYESPVISGKGTHHVPIVFTHHVSIEEKGELCAGVFKKCSGVYLSDIWVLTSASCISQTIRNLDDVNDVDSLMGRVGVIPTYDGRFIPGKYSTGTIASLGINSIHIHPEFSNDSSSKYDIALVKVDQSFVDVLNWIVQPACLPIVQHYHAVIRWLQRSPPQGYISTLYKFDDHFAERINLNFGICYELNIIRNVIRCKAPDLFIKEDFGVPLTIYSETLERHIVIGTGSHISVTDFTWSLMFTNIARSLRWIISKIASVPRDDTDKSDLN